MMTFAELVTSRRAWIDEVLKPWCRAAARRDLLLAEQEWPNLAGKVAVEMTLWSWAWSRFPGLGVEDGRAGVDETWPVRVTTHDGQTREGYPDSRASIRGTLVLITSEGQTLQPISIDDIAGIEQLRD